MKTIDFKVGENVSYDAKMAGEIVTALSETSANVFIIAGNARVNAKSIIGVISLALKPGDEISVQSQGNGEEEAVQIVKKLLG